jgi:hypothetical protein
VPRPGTFVPGRKHLSEGIQQVSSRLGIRNPDIGAFQGASEQDAMSLEDSRLQLPRRRPIFTLLVLAPRLVCHGHHPALFDDVGIDHPRSTLPRKVVQPKDPDVIIIEPPHGGWTADLAKWVFGDVAG